MSKKKKRIVIAVIVVAAVIFIDIVALVISFFYGSRNEETGVELSVSNVSRKGMTFALEREEKPENDAYVSTNVVCILEKKTLLGWRTYAEAGSGGTYLLKNGAKETWDLSFEHIYDEEPLPGIYRFGINIWTTEKGERQKETLYKTFWVPF